MVGRFDDEQRLTPDRRKIRTAGPVKWADDDEDRSVKKIDVDFIAGDGKKCNGTLDQTIRQEDNPPRWEFLMNNNGMAGVVTAKAKARMDDDSERTWEQQVTIVAV
jgi:hypothetical protein